MRPMRLLGSRLASVVLTIATAACGGSSKPAPTTPPPAPDPIPTTTGPDCAIVADKLAIVVHADKPDAQANARGNLKRQCADDKWSDNARSCFATVETDDELDGCRQHLDASQKAAFEKLAPARDAWTGEAAPAAAAPAASPTSAAPPPAPPAKSAPKKRSTRGATPKGDSADPQEGGE
jgi:hypothetical protein